MVSAYTTFVNHGYRSAPIYVTKIVDSEGKEYGTDVLARPGNEVIDAETAERMIYLLRGVVDGGTGARLRRAPYNFTAAMGGKTGTTNSNSDGWFMGITPKLVSGCWVGGDDRDIHFESMAYAQGAAAALPVFGLYMKKVYADKSLGISQSDEFNLKRNYNPDWQLTALLGLTFKLGKKKAAPAPAPVVYEEPAPAPAPAPKPVVKPEPKPEPKPVVKPEPLEETFFYNIRLSDPDPDAKLNRIVAWCKKYPQKGITIKGYADKGTGTPALNVGYAKARAEKVAKALQEKGISADRMSVSSYGDTVQPFPENDLNRCVIVVGE
jgi:membrane peptidoglycan carboxypeptidase